MLSCHDDIHYTGALQITVRATVHTDIKFICTIMGLSLIILKVKK